MRAICTVKLGERCAESLTPAAPRPPPARTPVLPQGAARTASAPAPRMPALAALRARHRRIRGVSQALRRVRTTAIHWSTSNRATALADPHALRARRRVTPPATSAAAALGWRAAPITAMPVGTRVNRISARPESRAQTPQRPAHRLARSPAEAPTARMPALSLRAPASPTNRRPRTSTTTHSPDSISPTARRR